MVFPGVFGVRASPRGGKQQSLARNRKALLFPDTPTRYLLRPSAEGAAVAESVSFSSGEDDCFARRRRFSLHDLAADLHEFIAWHGLVTLPRYGGDSFRTTLAHVSPRQRAVASFPSFRSPYLAGGFWPFSQQLAGISA